jgi:hypothetical protein
MIGVPWIVNLLLEAAEVAIFFVILLSFVGTYRRTGQGVMINLISFSALMIVFEAFLIYLTYFLSTRFGAILATMVLILNMFLVAALYMMFRVVNS